MELTVKPRIKAILLDMDGVLYHGEKVIPEAISFMNAIAHLPHTFITNNPILPASSIADRLQRMGFQRPDSNKIITSAEATALWLSEQKEDFHYFAVGAEGLHLALREHGIEDKNSADFVVIGEGAGIDYDMMTIGINLILNQNARLICTNPDHSVDAFINEKHTVLAGGGALVAPFAIATKTEPVFIGKPHPLLYQMAMKKLNTEPENCLMIGDRPDTDIAGANALGIKTALIRTGRFSPGDLISDDISKPDWDVNSLNELLPKIEAMLKAKPKTKLRAD